jgi:hypothetical protein
VLLYALVAFGAVSFVFASVARVPFPTRLWVAALGGVIGAVVTVVGVRVVQAVGERSMMAVLEPGGRGRDTAVYSHAEALASQGNLNLILMPAAFTYVTGAAHWEILLRARAIENQCYVLASAQGGRHENGRRTWGHSMLIDPWGESIASVPEGEGVAIGDMDPARIAQVRRDLPALKHRVM